MTPDILIGIDIGTQGTKAAFYKVDGRCLASAFVKSRLHSPRPGVVEEDAERQVASVCESIRRCVKSGRIDPARVAGIGIDGQMAGILGVDRSGRAVTPYDSWLDTRCAPYIELMKKKAGEEIIKKAGGPPSFNHGPKILRWKKEFKNVYRSICAFVQPGGYAVMRLCGLKGAEAFIDKSYLHFSGFADNRGNCWDPSLCRTFDVDMAKLPSIVDPRSVVGMLTADMARRCGLKAGVPVVAGCGDTAASFLACGAVSEGICVDVAGTASVFAATTRQFRPDIKNNVLSCGQSAVPGLWHPYAYINGGGMNLEWFRKNFAPQLSFERLERMAQISCRENDPVFIPHLAGRVSPSQPDIRGAWAGLTWNQNIGNLYHSILESVAMEYRIYKDVLTGLYPGLRLKEIRITGGGEKSAMWNSIKADVLGCSVVQISHAGGAPMGAALLAGFGIDAFDDLGDAVRQWVKIGRTTRPDRAMSSCYAERYGRYVSLLEQMNEWSKK